MTLIDWSFIRGWSLTYWREDYMQSSFIDDSIALRGDWERVGGYIQEVLTHD